MKTEEDYSPDNMLDDGNSTPIRTAHPPNIADEWAVWRLVTEGVATLEEIERAWWIEDVLDANEALDVLEYLQPSRLGR